MDCNHDEQPQELTLFEGLKEDLAWVAGAGVVAGACWLFIGDDYAYLLVVPVLAAIYFLRQDHLAASHPHTPSSTSDRVEDHILECGRRSRHLSSVGVCMG